MRSSFFGAAYFGRHKWYSKRCLWSTERLQWNRTHSKRVTPFAWRARRICCSECPTAVVTCERARGQRQDDLIVAAYANQGDLAKAAAAKVDVLRVAPGYTVAQLRAKRYSDNPEYQPIADQYWYEGLRKAGFSEQ